MIRWRVTYAFRVIASTSALLLGSFGSVTANEKQIKVIVENEDHEGVHSYIYQLTNEERLYQRNGKLLDEVSANPGWRMFKIQCLDTDWLKAVPWPLGQTLYQQTPDSHPKECKEGEAKFVFGYAKTTTVLFDSDSSEIETAGKALMEQYATIVTRQSGRLIRLVGHADRAEGPPDYNMALSIHRADAVREALVDAGVPADQIIVHWRGESEPAVLGAGDVAKNRRVQVILQEAEPPTQTAVVPETYLVLFNWDKADLNEAGQAVIEQVLSDAQSMGTPMISVTGFADRSGPEDYNMALSLRRAMVVRDALIAAGIAPEQITVSGRGESEPAVTAAEGVREQANRRVEVTIQ